MPETLPQPGPSFVEERDVAGGGRRLRAGMARPTTTDDGWWLAILWVADGTNVVSFRDAGPAAGPPPEPPLTRLGPAFSGALSGYILEDAGRLSIRLSPVVPPENPAQPWRCPLAIRAAFRWEPMRVASTSPEELAATVLAAFARAVATLGRP